MLQVARLAPQQLGESRDLVAAYLTHAFTDQGGVADRSGRPDLYYTVFGLEGLIALQAPLPVDRVVSFLRSFGDGESLDFVHLACLIRSWASVSSDAREVPVDALARRLLTFVSADGTFATTTGAPHGSLYASFLAIGALQDLQQPLPDAAPFAALAEAARAPDGGYGNSPGDTHGLTPTTAAAALLLRELNLPRDPHLGVWLLDRCHRDGGFFATPAAPMPDLLSTATALHALATLNTPTDAIVEPCLDFVDSLWLSRGGFCGTWADDTLDVEYTYYGLLALGHLSLTRPA